MKKVSTATSGAELIVFIINMKYYTVQNSIYFLCNLSFSKKSIVYTIENIVYTTKLPSYKVSVVLSKALVYIGLPKLSKFLFCPNFEIYFPHCAWYIDYGGINDSILGVGRWASNFLHLLHLISRVLVSTHIFCVHCVNQPP